MERQALRQNQPTAFTVLELLVVIGVIGILASLAILAINPKRQYEQSFDATRRQHLKVMTDALYQYQIDYGIYPQVTPHPTLDTQQRDLCSLTEPPYFTCTLDVPDRLVLTPLIPDYLAELPHDPKNEEEYETGYRLWLDVDGRIHADAPLSDDPDNLEISR